MNPGILSLLLPIIAVLVVGGLVGLWMLKPYGDRILDLIQEMNRSRQEMLEEERALQQVRDRLDALDDRLATVAERQDFLESLVENRLESAGPARELPRQGREGRAPSPDREGAPDDREDGG